MPPLIKNLDLYRGGPADTTHSALVSVIGGGPTQLTSLLRKLETNKEHRKFIYKAADEDIDTGPPDPSNDVSEDAAVLGDDVHPTSEPETHHQSSSADGLVAVDPHAPWWSKFKVTVHKSDAAVVKANAAPDVSVDTHQSQLPESDSPHQSGDVARIDTESSVPSLSPPPEPLPSPPHDDYGDLLTSEAIDSSHRTSSFEVHINTPSSHCFQSALVSPCYGGAWEGGVPRTGTRSVQNSRLSSPLMIIPNSEGHDRPPPSPPFRIKDMVRIPTQKTASGPPTSDFDIEFFDERLDEPSDVP